MEQIKRARIEKGWTQERLAASLGVQRAVISKYESGRVSPTVEQLQAIAAALGVPVADLLIGPPIPGDGTWVDEYGTRRNGPPETRTSADLLPDEFNEFERFIETLGYYTRLDGDNYRLHKGKNSVVITPDELKALVRASKATVAALVQDLMETAARPSDTPEGPQEAAQPAPAAPEYPSTPDAPGLSCGRSEGE